MSSLHQDVYFHLGLLRMQPLCRNPTSQHPSLVGAQPAPMVPHSCQIPHPSRNLEMLSGSCPVGVFPWVFCWSLRVNLRYSLKLNGIVSCQDLPQLLGDLQGVWEVLGGLLTPKRPDLSSPCSPRGSKGAAELHGRKNCGRFLWPLAAHSPVKSGSMFSPDTAETGTPA